MVRQASNKAKKPKSKIISKSVGDDRKRIAKPRAIAISPRRIKIDQYSAIALAISFPHTQGRKK
jgi:hypothetical protein